MYDFEVFIPAIVGVAIALLSILGSYIGSEVSSYRSRRIDLTDRIEELRFEISYHDKKNNNKQGQINQEIDIEELRERYQFWVEKAHKFKIRRTALISYSLTFVICLIISVILPVILPVASISNNLKLYEYASKIIPKASIVGVIFNVFVLLFCYFDSLKWHDCPEKTDSFMLDLKNYSINKENHNGQERKTL